MSQAGTRGWRHPGPRLPVLPNAAARMARPNLNEVWNLLLAHSRRYSRKSKRLPTEAEVGHCVGLPPVCASYRRTTRLGTSTVPPISMIAMSSMAVRVDMRPHPDRTVVVSSSSSCSVQDLQGSRNIALGLTLEHEPVTVGCWPQTVSCLGHVPVYI